MERYAEIMDVLEDLQVVPGIDQYGGRGQPFPSDRTNITSGKYGRYFHLVYQYFLGNYFKCQQDE